MGHLQDRHPHRRAPFLLNRYPNPTSRDQQGGSPRSITPSENSVADKADNVLVKDERDSARRSRRDSHHGDVPIVDRDDPVQELRRPAGRLDVLGGASSAAPAHIIPNLGHRPRPTIMSSRASSERSALQVGRILVRPTPSLRFSSITGSMDSPHSRTSGVAAEPVIEVNP